MIKDLKALAAVLALMTFPVIAEALPVTYTASDATRAASATFDVVGGNLVVTLANTSSNDVAQPIDVLTAVYFTIASDPAFTRISAALNAGSTTTLTPAGAGSGTDAGGVVGGEWAYKNGLSAFGNNEGISSSGLGLFGPGDRFPGTNREGPDSPDGLQYGITSAGDNQATGNGGVQLTLIKNSVLFTLGSVPLGFNPLTDITAVTFQYGTALTEPHLEGSCIDCPNTRTPEPGTLALLGGSVLGLFGLARRRGTAR